MRICIPSEDASGLDARTYDHFGSAPFYALDDTLPWSDLVEAYSAQQNYCLVRVRGGRVTMTVYGESGEVIDQAVLREER